MQKLVKGIHHFQSQIFWPQREFFEGMAKGQRPETLFITCSDSRINPNLITQTAPGELFILRNAGNIVPPHGAANGGEGATIEYAVSALEVNDIIVCGHSHCGAMQAIISPDQVKELPLMERWLQNAEATRQIVKANYRDLTGDSLLEAAIEENVLVQIEHLRTHPVVAARIASGKLHLHGWVYQIDTGAVFTYDPDESDFVPLSEGKPPSIRVNTIRPI